MNISREQATDLVESALEHASKTEHSVSIAVVDTAGFLVSFQRVTEGRIPNIELAIKKARTAARWERPTRMLTDVVQPGEEGYGIQHSNSDIVVLKGGLPILDDMGNVIGAISADGAPTDVDDRICEQALADQGYSTTFKSPFKEEES